MGVAFKTVTNEKEAIDVRKLMANQALGIIRIDTKFRRGLNIKMLVPPLLVIVANGKSFHLRDIIQMEGRGFRTQVSCQGLLLMQDEQASSSALMWREIEARVSNKPQDSVKNLILLRQILAELTRS